MCQCVIYWIMPFFFTITRCLICILDRSYCVIFQYRRTCENIFLNVACSFNYFYLVCKVFFKVTIKNKIMEACSNDLPTWKKNTETFKIMRVCLQKKKGFCLYQLIHMAELVEDDTEVTSFDLSLASTYWYNYFWEVCLLLTGGTVIWISSFYWLILKC